MIMSAIFMGLVALISALSGCLLGIAVTRRLHRSEQIGPSAWPRRHFPGPKTVQVKPRAQGTAAIRTRASAQSRSSVATTTDAITKLQSAILRVLSQNNQPLKAAEIAKLINWEKSATLHKRDINPTLYQMRWQGLLSRDLQYRWLLNQNGCRTASLPKPQVVRNSATHATTDAMPWNGSAPHEEVPQAKVVGSVEKLKKSSDREIPPDHSTSAPKIPEYKESRQRVLPIGIDFAGAHSYQTKDGRIKHLLVTRHGEKWVIDPLPEDDYADIDAPIQSVDQLISQPMGCRLMSGYNLSQGHDVDEEERLHA